METVTSGERGKKVTIIVAVSAIVNHVPVVLIVPTVLLKNHVLTGAPTASVGAANSTVWPNERVCLDCLKNFIACETSCKEGPVDLILDNHEFHLSIPAVNVRKEDGIFFLTLPPHTSHKLQQLYCTVFGPYDTLQCSL